MAWRQTVARASCARERLQEQGLLAELPQLPDLQCAWLLLLFCAAPRAQHLLRTVPPSQSAAHAETHDHAATARSLARMRGLGLRLCRLTRALCCARRTCTPPCAGACASRCLSRTGIAEAMGSRGAAPSSMFWATMRQRPRSGLLARRAPLLEQAWVRVAREDLGPEGRVVPQYVPQQWLANTSAPGVSAQDRRRLNLVLYGATRLGEALCCDATLVAPLRRDGRPQPRAAEEDGAAIAVARRRKEARCPELCRPGPQRLVVLARAARGVRLS